MQPTTVAAANSRPHSAFSPPPDLPQAHSTALPAFAGALLGMVRNAERDLSARQLGVLVTLAIQPNLNTVRSLAVHLRVSKPAITRAADRLEAEGLAKRRTDPADRRSVLLTMTQAGRALVGNIEAGLMQPEAVEA